ncbi:LCP family protein [Exiguobacterium aestuarii]|uniref:LCP family protein n=1 Tax=Exiguobacterium aestuarii TaxID=273527 RepID=UPI001CD47A64|nr:LCP family protein [Exiguobacterium aestuarii]MCA0982062.1 LCP family protein [Exiguobacterium aestuarii]
MKDDQRLSRVERRKRELEQQELEASRLNDEQSSDERPNINEVSERNRQHEGTSPQSEHPFLNEKSSESSKPNQGTSKNRRKRMPRMLSFSKPKRKTSRPKSNHAAQQSRPSNPSKPSKREVDQSAKPTNKRKRKWKGKVAVFLILMLLVGGYVATSPFTFLIMGSDARVGESLSGSRTDSLQLMEFVPRSRTVQNVSIPRDTYTAIPCEPDRDGDKITHAFAYGGATCTVGAVEGLTDASVDGQVVITFESFMELIDLIGGVNVTATHSFSEKGFNQTYEYTEGVSYAMDGDMALAYARHRKSDTDGARSNRQTEVMTAVAEKLASPSGWTKIPATYRFMKEEMGLEMNVLQMASVGLTMISNPDVNKMQVEGQDAYINNVYYYEPLEESVQSIRDALDLSMWGTVR